MLNGLYGYIFGGANAESTPAQGDVSLAEEVQPSPVKSEKANKKGKASTLEEASEWILVDNECPTKSNPEMEVDGEGPLLDECKSLSSSAPSMTASWSESMDLAANTAHSKLEKLTAKQQKRMANNARLLQRQYLTKMLFSDPNSNKVASTGDNPPNNFDTTANAATNNPSSNRLKRASQVEHVQSQAKTKPRSKKSQGGKFNSNRNNDRKCNPHNLD